MPIVYVATVMPHSIIIIHFNRKKKFSWDLSTLQFPMGVPLVTVKLPGHHFYLLLVALLCSVFDGFI